MESFAQGDRWRKLQSETNITPQRNKILKTTSRHTYASRRVRGAAGAAVAARCGAASFCAVAGRDGWGGSGGAAAEQHCGSVFERPTRACNAATVFGEGVRVTGNRRELMQELGFGNVGELTQRPQDTNTDRKTRSRKRFKKVQKKDTHTHTVVSHTHTHPTHTQKQKNCSSHRKPPTDGK